MGRSVNVLNNAQKIAYFDVSSMGDNTEYQFECECGEEWTSYESKEDCEICESEVEGTEQEIFDEYQSQEDWDYFKENIIESLKKKYKSLDEVSKEWDNDETMIILRNSQVEFGISEYCGCASLSVQVIAESDYESEGEFRKREVLGSAWISKTWDNICKVLDENVGYTRLGRIGTFSNGSAVFEKVS